MQTLLQNRTSTRMLILVLVTSVVIFLSWRLTSARELSSSIEDVYGYLADSSARAPASTDTLIQTLQERLRQNPDDWQSYSQLGVAFLQKARETGDPAYYQRAEEALDQALSLQPSDYVSISARGALALARHDFVAALEWGEKAMRINPSRTYAYGVVADAQVELGRY
ncbi:MAG: hypothetical protein M3Y68_08675, partial [Chloroflexota bacterium]|nr:hypothetical protein [Chloroflexota bacterium]